MRRFLFFFIILFILVGVFNVGIFKKSIKDVQARMTGQIGYRINVVKGVVESGNINKTYNCYIAGEPVVYPNIPTLSRDPKLKKGDNVTIEFLNGCVETPAILAPEDIRERPDTTPVTVEIEGEIFISFWTGGAGAEVGYIKPFTSDGVAGTKWTAEDYQLLYNGFCVDSSGNIFYIANTQPNHTLVKYNSTGTEITKIVVSYQAMAIAMADDGYIYTLENTQTDNDIMTKRDPNTLAIISTFQLDPTHSYYGMAFLNNDRFYVVNSSDDFIEMWRVATGAEIAQVAITPAKTTLASLAVAGSTVLGTDFANDPWYVPTNLGAGETDWAIGIARCFSVASKDGFFYVLGNNSDGGILYLGKYTEGGGLVWLIEAVAAGYYPSSVGAYPF